MYVMIQPTLPCDLCIFILLHKKWMLESARAETGQLTVTLPDGR